MTKSTFVPFSAVLAGIKNQIFLPGIDLETGAYASSLLGPTTVLSRTEVARLMDYAGYVDAVEAAFRAAMNGRAVAPPAAAIDLPDGSFHAKGAALLGEFVDQAAIIGADQPNQHHRLSAIFKQPKENL